MEDRTKNIIGGIGLSVLLLAGVSWAAYAYWPVSWTKSGALLKANLDNMSPESVQKKLAATDLDQLNDQQKTQLAVKLRGYVDGLSDDDRRKLMRSDDPNLRRKNMELMQQYMMATYVREYGKAASQEDRDKVLDKFIDDAAGRFGRGGPMTRPATQPTTRPGGGGPGGGPGGGFGRGAQRGIQRQVNTLENGNTQDRAAQRQFFEDLRRRAQQRGLPTFGGGPR